MRFLKRNIYDKLLLEGLIIFQVLKKAEFYKKNCFSLFILIYVNHLHLVMSKNKLCLIRSNFCQFWIFFFKILSAEPETKIYKTINFRTLYKISIYIYIYSRISCFILYGLFKKKWLQHVKKIVHIKLTPKNFLLIIFNVVYIEVNETRKKLWTDKQ